MSLYLWIDILSISVPLVVSFHPKVELHKKWKYLFPAILISMIPYIIWDVYFTDRGYWGFSDEYLMGVVWLGLPIEEWLFFVCIPYACVFTHIVILKINSSLALSDVRSGQLTFVLTGLFSIVSVFNFSKAYTFVDTTFAVVILMLVYFLDRELLRKYYITFLFMLIPFFLVNGVLTGSGIVDQVVWYNDEENLKIRLLTIPIEDICYAFSLILLNLFLFRQFSRTGRYQS